MIKDDIANNNSNIDDNNDDDNSNISGKIFITFWAIPLIN